MIQFIESFLFFHKENKKLFGISSMYFKNWFSYANSLIQCGCGARDYWDFEFYNKSIYERKKYLTLKFIRQFEKEYCHGDKWILEDKIKFNTNFNEYLKRDWMNVKESSLEDFRKFILEHKEVVFKPVNDHFGNGVWKYQYSEKDDLKKLYKKQKNSLMEEVIIQHNEMAKLNPSTCNTVRVVTLCKDGKVKIVAATLRIGVKGSCADNLHAGGCLSGVDPEGGVTFTIAKNGKHERFVYHPITNERLVGFEIPHWDKVKKMVRKAALQVEDICYVGWDVAIMQEDVCLIEGNFEPGMDVTEVLGELPHRKILEDFMRNQ